MEKTNMVNGTMLLFVLSKLSRLEGNMQGYKLFHVATIVSITFIFLIYIVEIIKGIKEKKK